LDLLLSVINVSVQTVDIVNGVLRGEKEYGSVSKIVAVSLYARYLKRIGAHLKNITTTIVNPFDSIGYKQ